MVQTENDNPAWMLMEKLSPSLFTENFLIQTSFNEFLIYRQLDQLFKNICTSVNDETVQNLISEANISNKYYSTVLFIRKWNDDSTGTWGTFAELPNYNLFDLISRSNKKRLDEKIARYYLIQLLNVLEELHSKQVYYLTLRYEDIGLTEDFNLKLNDFGIPNAIIKISQNLAWVKDLYLKNSSLSPEVSILSSASEKSDVFNLGVILFSMVIGFRPFKELNSSTDFLFKVLQQKDIKKYWEYINEKIKFELSNDFKDLIFKMLCVAESQRITIEDIKKHHWLVSNEIENETNIMLYFKDLLTKRNLTNKR